MPTGHPKNGINKGWFKKGSHSNVATEFKKGHKLWTVERIKKMANSLKGKTAGSKHYNWQGGQFVHQGWILIQNKNHPHCNNNGYIKKSHLVMEKYIGRFLEPGEIVHHKNKIRTDDRIENLHLFKNQSEHFSFHKKEYWKNYRKNKYWKR